MNKTKIEYVDFTWNPVTGCLHGCEYCYARKISKRFGDDFKPKFQGRLAQPTMVKKPSRILVCSMGDLFGEWVPDKWIQDVLGWINKAPQHTYLFLTKNPRRYEEFRFFNNHWIGTTCDTIDHASDFSDILFDNCHPNKFISCEPLLENLVAYLEVCDIKWLIVGGQTNPERLPEKIWISEIIKECRKNKIPIFLKNNLNWSEKIQEYPYF